MPPKRSRPKVIIMPVSQHGEGFFSDVWDGIKSAHDYIKKGKLISRGADLAAKIGVPHAGTIATAARELGYGKKRRHRRKVIKT